MQNVKSLLGTLLLISLFSIGISGSASATNTVYYVDASCSGCDSNNGTSPSTPWQTLSKVSAQTFGPGDQILLKSGEIWNGQLTLSGSGSASSPIILGTYGSGARPKLIHAGSGGVVTGTNISNWDISGLEVVASTTQPLDNSDDFADIISGHRSLNSGIYIEFNGTGPYTGISIHGNDVHGSAFNRQSYGVFINANYCQTNRTAEVANHISISDNDVHDVGWAGIKIVGCSGSNDTNMTSTRGGYSSVQVIGNEVWNTAVQGVLLQATVDSRASNNLVHDIGLYTGGVSWPPAGVWLLGTNRTELSYNEVWRVSDSGTNSDAAGIDIDWENTNATVTHNYVHDNKGNGIETLANQASTVKFNRLEGNLAATGTGPGQLGLTGYSYDPSPRFVGVRDLDFSQNVVISNGGTVGVSTQPSGGQTWTNNAIVQNDIAYANGTNAFDVQSTVGLTSGNNRYYSSTGSSFAGKYNGTSYTPLSAWQSATGFDSASSVTTGLPWRAASDFSIRQANGNWRYQSFDGTTFADLPTFGEISGRWTWSGYQGEPYLWVLADNQHPGLNAASVRTWTAPQAGVVDVQGQVAKLDTACGNGVNVKIVKNSNTTSPLLNQNLGASDGVGFSTNLSAVPVNSGDSLRFIVSSLGNIGCDRTSWDPRLVLRADNIAVVSSTSLTSLRNDFAGQVGLVFSTGASAETVTSLGRYEIAGSSQTHTLSIVRASDKVALASVNVNPASGSVDSLGFRNVTLSSPVALAANTSYYLVSTENVGGDQWYDYTTNVYSTTGRISLTGVVYNDGTWHAASGYPNQSYGPLQFSIIP